MGYVEWLRVRRSFTIYAIVLLAGTAFLALSVLVGIHNGHRDGSSFSISSGGGSAESVPLTLAEQKFQVPLSWLFAIAGFYTLIFSTIVSTSLNKENGRGGFAFTKPISRRAVALTYMAIDLAAILVAFVYALALMLGIFALFGILGKVYVDAGAGSIALAVLGVSLMWYGLLQVATAPRAASGGLFIGLSWPFFLVFLALHGVVAFGSIFHDLVIAVDFFNPLGYFILHTVGNGLTVTPLLGFPQNTSIAITWIVAAVSCVGAVFTWNRAEA